MTHNQKIAADLRSRIHAIGAKRAFIGFDGFVDELVRVVKSKENEQTCSFFSTIAEFAEHVAAAAGKSADIELVSQETKLGGNAPIMANALASLGVATTCVGAMGYPEAYAVFNDIHSNCRRISVCDPAYTYAYEFNDGKLMIANHHQLNALNWEYLKSKLSIAQMVQLVEESELLGFVNWSVMSGADSIWRGFFSEVFPCVPEKARKEKTIFFDLADPAKRSKEDILSVLDLINQFAAGSRVILGLNENEACRVFAAMQPDDGNDDATLEQKAQYIFDQLQVELLVVHPIDRCILVSKEGLAMELGTLVKEPKITTGGGDNFNAGFCFAHQLGLKPRDAARAAMATSGFYVRNGYSPSHEELIAYLEIL